jgi:hypothetical protein
MRRAYSNQSGGPSSICGRGQADVVERHAHRSRRLVERVATPFEIAAHRGVAFVNPGSEARDACGRVRSLDRIHRAPGSSKIALEKRVVL